MAIENITDLEKSLNLPEGTLKTAIESTDSVSIDLSLAPKYTEDEHTQRVENLKPKFYQQGIDFAIKEQKEKLGLDFTGKGIDSFITAFKEKVVKEVGATPDEKAKEYESTIAKLRQNLTEQETTFNTFKQQIEAEKTNQKIESDILKAINIETSIPKEDVLTIFKSKHQIEIEDGKVLVKKNGEVLKDEKTLSPLELSSIVSSFASEYAKTPQGGRGGQHEPPTAKSGSIESFIERMDKEGINQGSAEFNKRLLAEQKAGTVKI
jgi:hypothetical protein